jgi:lysozyme family protein
MDFTASFVKLCWHEGGYQDGEGDPGGETKFGISKRSYPAEDIRNLTLERAKFLAFRDFWSPAGCDALPDKIKFDVFDIAFNSGPVRAIKLLQKAVGEVEDGVLGPHTLQATNSMDPIRLLTRLNAARLLYMTDLDNWPQAGKGWTRRVATNMMET